MNPKLKQYEAGIEENIRPEDKEDYDRIVTAGLKVIASDEFHQQMLNTLDVENAELADKIADGVARLISLLHISSEGKMPVGPTIAAAYTFTIKAMDIAERALGAEITDDLIADTTLKTMSVVCPLLGISQEKLRSAMQGQQPEAQLEAPVQPTKPMGLMQQAPTNGGM